MLNLFSFLQKKSSGSYLGLDIGTTSIKIAEVRLGKPLPHLVNYGILESWGALARENTALQTSTLKLFEQEALDLLKTLLGKMRPSTKKTIASLPLFSAFTTVLDFPEISSGDLKKAIAFQAAQYVPVPLSEVALDWTKVGEYEDEKGFKHIQVLLISVPHEHIKRYQELCKNAGLELLSLEVESLCIVRSLIGSDITPTVIIDVGSRSTAIAITEGGTLRFTGQTDFAGASLTQALASSLNISPIRAEELKKERGVLGTGPNYELSTIMVPFLDAIISEVKRVDYTYHNQFPKAGKIERAILSGGGANLLGAQKYFQEQLGVPAVKAAPLFKFERSQAIDPLVPELGPALAVSLGLALRETEETV